MYQVGRQRNAQHATQELSIKCRARHTREITMFGFMKRQQASTAQDQEINQLRQMLDCVDNLIMLADTTPDNTIIYMNKTARDTL
ncbi:MAG: PAS domain-containing protein, partial [Vogesella sp.]|uniref:PAS domain-containing protein n=1 Tax=Vogesella sp. TaxID=1904252 RepID=UPI003F34370E